MESRYIKVPQDISVVTRCVRAQPPYDRRVYKAKDITTHTSGLEQSIASYSHVLWFDPRCHVASSPRILRCCAACKPPMLMEANRKILLLCRRWLRILRCEARGEAKYSHGFGSTGPSVLLYQKEGWDSYGVTAVFWEVLN